MVPLGQILVPIDFSDASAGALRCARAFAFKHGSHVTVFHSMPIPPYERGWGGSMWPDRRNQVEAEMATLIAEELKGVTATSLIADGDAAHTIISYVESRHPDLVVMPTHGGGALVRLVLGSTTTRVLEAVETPVITGVHVEPGKTFANIVCAVDLSPASTHALEWAAKVALSFQSRVFAVHSDPGLGSAPDEDYFEGAREDAESVRAKLAILAKACGVEAMTIVTGGEPAEAILHQAKELSADLIVIGRGAIREGLARRLRAHSMNIIRQAHCPVLSV